MAWPVKGELGRDRLDAPPEGNHVPSRAQLAALLREDGLTETAAFDPASLPAPPACWREPTATSAENWIWL